MTDYSDLAALAAANTNGDEIDAMSTNGRQPETPDLLAGLRNGAWLEQQNFPPLRYHLAGIIPEGFTLLVGPPKIGKSWFVLALALATAAGARALGQPVDARPVLYLALEDGHRRLQDRCRTLLGGAGIPAAFEYLTVTQPNTVVATIESWMARHPNDEPQVILDTLGKVMPPALLGESSYGRDYRVGTVLKRIVDDQPGSALIVNHHDRKAASEDFVEKVSGSNGLAGSADTIVVLARRRHENDGTIDVTGRDVTEGQYAVSFDGAHGLWTLTGGSLASAATAAATQRHTEGLDERSRQIVAYVAEQPEGVRAADVAQALGVEVHQARTYLARLAESDRIDRADRGLYTPVASVASVASDSSDPLNATGATHATALQEEF